MLKLIIINILWRHNKKTTQKKLTENPNSLLRRIRETWVFTVHNSKRRKK